MVCTNSHLLQPCEQHHDKVVTILIWNLTIHCNKIIARRFHHSYIIIVTTLLQPCHKLLHVLFSG